MSTVSVAAAATASSTRSASRRRRGRAHAARTLTAAARIGSIEAATIARLDRAPPEALAVWRTLSLAAQIEAAREVAGGRAAEMTAAYRNLVAVSAGMRTRRAGDVVQRHCEPCVVFVVKRKWSTPGGSGRDPALPHHLLHPVTIGGQRLQAAIPTDVQPARWLLGLRACAKTSIAVVDPSINNQPDGLVGTLTCGVRVEGGAHQDENFAMSAMHVLSPRAMLSAPTRGLSVRRRTGDAEVGESHRFGGVIGLDEQFIFDVQLARITDRSWFNDAHADLKLAPSMPYCRRRADFQSIAAGSFRVQIASDHVDPMDSSQRTPIRMHWTHWFEDTPLIRYIVRDADNFFLEVQLGYSELLLFEPDDLAQMPIDGDSGSAVFCERDSGRLTLVGMLIGSGIAQPLGEDDPQALVAVLPAWHLFDLDLWTRPPPGATGLRPTFRLG